MADVEPMIFRDRGKRTEFAEYTLWNGIAYFKVQTCLIAAYALSNLHVIAAFFRFGNPLQWRLQLDYF